MSKGLEFLKRKLRDCISDGAAYGSGSDGTIYFLDKIAAKVYHGIFYYGNRPEPKAAREARIMAELHKNGLPVPRVYGIIAPDDPFNAPTRGAIRGWTVFMERIDGVHCDSLRERDLEVAEAQYNRMVAQAFSLGYEPIDHGNPSNPFSFDPDNTNVIFDSTQKQLYALDVLRWHHISESMDFFHGESDGRISKSRLKQAGARPPEEIIMK